eukprot:859286-Pyramimonas_sp.AAC.1
MILTRSPKPVSLAHPDPVPSDLDDARERQRRSSWKAMALAVGRERTAAVATVGSCATSHERERPSNNS